MIRVLQNEMQWRARRLRIASQEYDNKIVRMMNIISSRREALKKHAELHDDSLVTPLSEYFAKKTAELEQQYNFLKERMRQLLLKPVTVKVLHDVIKDPTEKDWRERVKSALNPGDPDERARAHGDGRDVEEDPSGASFSRIIEHARHEKQLKARISVLPERYERETKKPVERGKRAKPKQRRPAY